MLVLVVSKSRTPSQIWESTSRTEVFAAEGRFHGFCCSFIMQSHYVQYYHIRTPYTVVLPFCKCGPISGLSTHGFFRLIKRLLKTYGLYELLHKSDRE